MVILLLAQDAVTPAGNPVAVPMLVATVVAWVIVVKAVLLHTVGVEEAAATVLLILTVIVPVAFTVPQPPPVKGML